MKRSTLSMAGRLMALTLLAMGAATREVAAQGAVGSMPVGVGLTSPAVVKEFPGADVKQVFAALDASYRKGRIAITLRDEAANRLGNLSFPVRKSIGNLRVERAFDCGGDKKKPLAVEADLILSIYSDVARTAKGVEVRTHLTATGTIPSDSGVVTVNCSSRGVLEERLVPGPSMLPITTILVRRGSPAGRAN